MEIGQIGLNNLNTKIEKKEEKNLLLNFADYLKDAMNETSKLENYSNKLSDDFAAGRTDNIHEVMIAGEKAGIALNFTMQIRNKILDSYNEIMRIQI